MTTSDSLRRRVAALEAKHAPRSGPAAEQPRLLDRYEFIGRLTLVAGGYTTWRHENLTLEELLAVANDDATRPESARWATNAKDAAREIEKGITNAKAAAREIEIRIGLRDGLIDTKAANELRKHLRADPVPALPYAVRIDDTVLASARAKCPRREDLPVEKQLAMLEEDHQRDLRERPQREAARQARIGRGDVDMGSLDPLRDRIYECELRELRQRL